MVFDEYAHYYDLLYKDKDYDAEANYIDCLIKKYNVNAKTILDLGCGTGKHAELLTKKGYRVHGIDLSEEMLQEAYVRAEKNEKLSFGQSNIQEFVLEEKFDVITALFHVMSYQTTDGALGNVFAKAYEHLNDKGIFIFDCWYGPAVLTEKPELRIKRLENDNVKITRIAEPVLRENGNIVEVHYDIFVKNQNTQEIREINETHIMRYLFKQEILQLLQNAGFQYEDSFEFMTDNELSMNTWGGCFVGRARKK